MVYHCHSKETWCLKKLLELRWQYIPWYKSRKGQQCMKTHLKLVGWRWANHKTWQTSVKRRLGDFWWEDSLKVTKKILTASLEDIKLPVKSWEQISQECKKWYLFSKWACDYTKEGSMKLSRSTKIRMSETICHQQSYGHQSYLAVFIINKQGNKQCTESHLLKFGDKQRFWSACKDVPTVTHVHLAHMPEIIFWVTVH